MLDEKSLDIVYIQGYVLVRIVFSVMLIFYTINVYIYMNVCTIVK